MLIIPKVRLPFDNLEELVESGITLAITQDSTLQTLIMVGAVRWWRRTGEDGDNMV